MKIKFATVYLVLFLGFAQSNAKADSDKSSINVKGLDIAGYNLEYIDSGRGEPIVFVHGAIGDYRTWSAYLKPISESARFISYSRRHYGTQDWPEISPTHDDQMQHASDLASLIESLDAGPVHLVSWSNSGKTLAILGATRPELIKSITQYEPVVSAKIMERVEEAVAPGKAFNAGWKPVVNALKSNNHPEAARKMIEHVFEMEPGGFSNIPVLNQQVVLDNARTIPLIFNDVTNDIYTCEYVGSTKAPTTIVVGQKTNEWWQLMSKRVADCHENAQLTSMAGVNHNGPVADVEAFTNIILNNAKKYQ